MGKKKKMLKATFKNTLLLKKTFDALKELVSETIIICNNESLEMQVMDNSHIAIIYLNINSCAFDEYICEERFSMGLNFTSFNKILKCIDGNDKLTILKNEDDKILLKAVSSDSNKV